MAKRLTTRVGDRSLRSKRQLPSATGTEGKKLLARPARPQGRSLSDFPDLTAAEKQLLRACRAGAAAVIGNRCPTKPTKQNSIRGEFIRFLALGGDEDAPVHEHGVDARGAYVTGVIDLTGCRIQSGLSLTVSTLADPFIAHDARTLGLDFGGSSICGFAADRISISGGLSMCDGFRSSGGISIQRATITGLLNISGATISHGGSSQKTCIDANGVYIRGSIRVGGRFSSIGQLSFDNAEIVGNFILTESDLDGDGGHTLDLNRAVIHGNLVFGKDFRSVGMIQMHGLHIEGALDCDGASFLAHGDSPIALHANGMRVGSGFFWKRIKDLRGEINLNAVRAYSLNDDISSWTGFSNTATFALNGFSYDRIGSGSPTDARTRIEWLTLPRPTRHADLFWPHPWDHLVKVLRNMGHIEDARLIAIAKQQRLRRLRLIGSRIPNQKYRGLRLWMDKIWAAFSNHLARILHRAYGLFAGYGYRPFRTVMWLVGVCTALSLVYYAGRDQGLFGPTSPIIHANQLFENCGGSGEAGKQFWTECEHMPVEYTRFQPFLYSMDVILPLVNLQQEDDWAPIVHTSSGENLIFGRILRGLMLLEILFGWTISLLFVAALGKTIEKD